MKIKETHRRSMELVKAWIKHSKPLTQVEYYRFMKTAKPPSYPKFMPRWEKCRGCPYKLWCKYFKQPLCLKR